MIAANAIGLGYRPKHHEEILTQKHNVQWFEGLADNYLDDDSVPFYKLMEIRERYPMVLHSVGMSLASPSPFDRDYMRRLKRLKERVRPEWMSDHLCWSSHGNAHHHDLLPVPLTEESVKRISRKIRRAQDILETRILIENLSSYIAYKEDSMTEAGFLAAVAREADCHILLDVNNIVVSARNHHFDAEAYLDEVPGERVKQIHLAGFLDAGTHYVDTHGDHVFPQVWELYSKVMEKFGPIPTMVEWDNNIPEFETVVAEINKATPYLQAVQQASVEVLRA